jgi:hypothetical protein
MNHSSPNCTSQTLVGAMSNNRYVYSAPCHIAKHVPGSVITAIINKHNLIHVLVKALIIEFEKKPLNAFSLVVDGND